MKKIYEADSHQWTVYSTSILKPGFMRHVLSRLKELTRNSLKNYSKKQEIRDPKSVVSESGDKCNSFLKQEAVFRKSSNVMNRPRLH